jgi:hypothetical protein
VKRPAFMFYPADWRKDPGLQSCGIVARGVWWEMLCLMHECEPYGTLSRNGTPLPDAAVAALIRVRLDAYSRATRELESAGVFSRDDNNVIYSRRMVRDERIRELRAAAGKQGGNPVLLKQKQDFAYPNSGGLLNHASNLDPTPSFSLAVAVSDSNKNTTESTQTDARATTEKAGVFSETGNSKANPHWQVPSVADHAELERFARRRGVDPTRFNGYPELFAYLVDLQKEENRGEREALIKRCAREAVAAARAQEMKGQ